LQQINPSGWVIEVISVVRLVGYPVAASATEGTVVIGYGAIKIKSPREGGKASSL
jgi:hypothetical protein